MTYPKRIVTEDRLRRLFNDGGYLEKLQSGELREDVRWSKHLNRHRSGIPRCTTSQIVAYFDQHNHKVAEVHQYVRSDNRLGASGLPDPKALLIDGIIYAVKRA